MDALRYFYLAIVLAIVSISRLIAWFASETAQRRERDIESDQRQERDIESAQRQERDPADVEQQQLGLDEEGLYRQWLNQRLDERTALEKERGRIQNLSPKAFAQLVADLPSIRCSVEYLLEIAERQLPNGNPLFFWDTISKLDGILSHRIPDKVCAVKKQGVGRALEQAETLEREAKLFDARLQSLTTRAKGLETFAQEHALRCAYEERELKDFKWQLIRPKRSFTLGDLSDWEHGHHGGHGGHGGDGGDGGDGGH
jgi:hypothetical protein